METNESLEKLERFLVRLRAAGERYAHAAADYELKEHERKVVLADAMKDAEEAGASSIAAQERDARTSDGYVEHLNVLHAARLELEVARADLDALKLAASLRQSQLANERAEIRAYST